MPRHTIRRRSMLALAIGVAWCSAAGFWAPLHAAPIQLPPIPLPPIPAPVVPVLELLAPVASPQCGNAIFASILLRTEFAAIPGGAPVDIAPVLGPMFLVCGTVGIPPGRLSCSPDATAKGILDQITTSVAGLPTPADTRAAGPVVEELVLLQDALPPPANTAGLAESVSGTLQCTPVSVASTPPPVGAPAPAPAPAAATEDFSSTVFGDVSGRVLPAADVSGPTPSSSAAPVIQPPAVRPVSRIRTGGFAYPVIFVLPLVALAIGGYLARGLTRPVY